MNLLKTLPKKPVRAIQEFIKLESASGIILFSLAVIALIISNTSAHAYYEKIFNIKLGVYIADFHLIKPLILWINEGLMTIFFLLVGLEIKRELFEGELNSLSKISLPAIAAFGGMTFPALIYILLNHADPIAMRGWAIPTATDIAFSLAILAVLGSRVPVSLKIFLTALAIFDDIGAMMIIAAFYTDTLAVSALMLVGLCAIALFLLNRLKIRNIQPYVIVGVLLWLAVLKSGVHATLAGVVLAFAIPLREAGDQKSPVRTMEHKLHPWIAYFVLPLFGFANAGVSFAGIHMPDLISLVPLGIILGLFLGKQTGIFLAVWLAVKLRLASMPKDGTWLKIYGIALVCGVGFTMSLFIGGLAFDTLPDPSYAALVRFGVLAGSLLSGLIGYSVLRMGE